MDPAIQAGLRFLMDAKPWRVEELNLTHQKIVCRADDGDVSFIEPEKFRLRKVEGDIELLVPDRNGVWRPKSNKWRSLETQREKAERVKRMLILRCEAKEIMAGKNLKAALNAVIALCEKEGWTVPSERTLRLWRAAAVQHPSLLAPAWSNCGNRYQGPDECLLLAMREVVFGAIANHDRLSMTDSWGIVEARYHELCTERKAHKLRHGSRKLRKFLSTIAWTELMKARLDPRTAAALTRVAKHVHTADLFWDMVEVDAAFLPIRILTEVSATFENPVLYIGIDVASGYPVCFHLTVQAPSTLPFIEAMRYMYLPKPADFDDRYKIKNRIEAYSKPIVLKVDNGSDFCSDTAREVVRSLHGDTTRCKPYTPQQKPHVERSIGVIKDFLKTLPGSLRSAISDEKRTPPDDEKLLTFEELVGELLRFLYDDYAMRVNELRSWRSRKAVAPYDIWLEMKKSHMEPMPIEKEEFEQALFFERTERTLNRPGILYDTFEYNSDGLTALYQQTGSIKVEILFSKLDAGVIYVIPRKGEEPIAAYDKNQDGLSMDRDTAKKLREEIREAGEILNRRTYAQRLARLRSLTQEAKGKSKAKQARAMDMLDRATKAARKTMPKGTNASVATPEKNPIDISFEFDENISGNARGEA